MRRLGLEGPWACASSSIGSCYSGAIPGPQYYDEVYFDSDSEAEDEQKGCDSKKKRKRHKILTNDELLYDPDQDDRDQAWVDMQRRGGKQHKQLVPFVRKASIDSEMFDILVQKQSRVSSTVVDKEET
eukprot:g40704.t1